MRAKELKGMPFQSITFVSIIQPATFGRFSLESGRVEHVSVVWDCDFNRKP